MASNVVNQAHSLVAAAMALSPDERDDAQALLAQIFEVSRPPAGVIAFFSSVDDLLAAAGQDGNSAEANETGGAGGAGPGA